MYNRVSSKNVSQIKDLKFNLSFNYYDITITWKIDELIKMLQYKYKYPITFSRSVC